MAIPFSDKRRRHKFQVRSFRPPLTELHADSDWTSAIVFEPRLNLFLNFILAFRKHNFHLSCGDRDQSQQGNSSFCEHTQHGTSISQERLFSTLLKVAQPISLSRQNSTSADSPDANLPVTQNDVRIVRRARDLLNSPAKWKRADNRQCPANESTYSLYCALEQATKEISGEFEHRWASWRSQRLIPFA